MSQRDEKDLFQNEKTGQGYGTEEGEKKESERCREKARLVEVEWCAWPEQTKQSQEPQGSWVSVSHPASKLFSHLFSGLER